MLNTIRFCFTKFFEVISCDKYLLITFFIAIVIFIIAILFNVSLPLILRFIIQSLLDRNSSNQQVIIFAVCGYGFIWTIAQVGEHIREISSIRAIEKTLRKLTLQFYEITISHFNPHRESHSTGSIINKLAIFRDGFQNLIWGFLFFLLPTLVEILSSCIILWYIYGFYYSAVLFITIIFYSLLTSFGLHYYIKYQSKTIEISCQISGFLSDRLFNIETVNYFGNPKRELQLLDDKLIHLEDKTTKTKQIFEMIRIVQGIVIGCALTLITYKTINNILKGNQDLSDFILINSYIIQFFLPLSSLGIVMNDIHRAFGEISGFLDLINPKETKKLVSNNLVPSNVPPSLYMKGLCFSYEDNNHSFLLKDISIYIKPGWKVGIVGPSGSGKSTLGKLLGGFYQPNIGEVFYNGTPYSSYDAKSLKKIIALAPQHVQVFNDTMLENILYANPDSSKEMLERAVRAAHLKEVINTLPNGINTFLGEQGACLSGGQKQRIGIARSIIREPLLYILDEPTSFLDIKTEKFILKFFESQRNKVTQIIITHQLHTLMNADWILVMKKGQLLAQGDPSFLINNCEFFRELWNCG